MLPRAYAYPYLSFSHTATTQIYTLSLHDALPISRRVDGRDSPVAHEQVDAVGGGVRWRVGGRRAVADRKSTRLNSSHSQSSYAVFCLRKKNTDRGSSGWHDPRCYTRGRRLGRERR